METLTKARIKKWGNSQGLRLSKSLLDSVGISVEDEVNIISINDAIVIKSAKDKNKEILKKLLSKINDGNRHGEIDWGGPVGREIW